MTILWLQPLNLKLLKSMRRPLPIYEITLHLKLFVRWVALLENCWELNVKGSKNSVLFGSKMRKKLNCLSCFKNEKMSFFHFGLLFQNMNFDVWKLEKLKIFCCYTRWKKHFWFLEILGINGMLIEKNMVKNDWKMDFGVGGGVHGKVTLENGQRYG